MARFSSLLPPETHEHADEHEIKLQLDASSPMASRIERIEKSAARRDPSHGEIARAIERALGLREIAAIDEIARIDRFSVYLDTPGLDLYRYNASLRVRRRGNGKCRVNAKRQDARGRTRGHLIRREWRYNLAPDVYEFLEASGFRSLLEHHFGDVLAATVDAHFTLAPIAQIHKRSTRVEFTGPGGQRFLLSLDRFRGFDCSTGRITGSTPELREIEIEALNGKATRALETIRGPLKRLAGVEPGRSKYQALVEELGIDGAAPEAAVRA